MPEGEGFGTGGAGSGSTGANSATIAGKSGIRDYFDYQADFGGSTTGDQAAGINAAALTINALAGTAGGVLFFPPGSYPFNSILTVPAGVWFMGSGWSESGGGQPARAKLTAGAAMATAIDLNGNGSGLVDIEVDDPAPFVTVSLVQVNGQGWRIRDCLLNLAAGALTTVQVQAPRGMLSGGRIIGSGAGSVTVSQTASDNIYIDARIIGSTSILHQSGVNVQYNTLHCTGGANTVNNIQVTAGEGIFVNVQTDAANNGTSPVSITAAAASLAKGYFTGCHFLAANVSAGTDIFTVDGSAGGGSQAIAMIAGCSSRADAGTPQAFANIVNKVDANSLVQITGCFFVDCDGYYRTTGNAPQIVDDVLLSRATPSVEVSRTPFRRAMTADFTTGTGAGNTTLANVSGAGRDMSFLVAANERCHWRAVLWCDALAADDMQIAFTGPAAPTAVRYGLSGFDAALAFQEPTAAAFGTAIVFGGNGAGTILQVLVEGTLINGANAGTVQLQFAKNANPGGTAALIRTGSFLEKVVTV